MQMIVSGPDMAQAKAIAKELSTGQGRLASYNGEQVLISMTTAEGMMMSRNNCFCKVTQQNVIRAHALLVLDNSIDSRVHQLLMFIQFSLNKI